VSIRVLLADDHALVRRGLRLILECEDDVVVVGEAEDGGQVVTLTAELQPDVVLMDVQMPVVDGLEATRRIGALGVGARVLVLTTFERDDYLFEALRGGASGFLLKNCPPEELVRAVRVVAGGEALLAPSATRRVIEDYLARPAVPGARGAGPDHLTDRELDVLRRLASGRSNAELARDLYVSEGTVKTHVSSILAKLGLRDRVQAVVYAYDHGLVDPARQIPGG
jgi:DNA-binding NarL/FixJ family response regulator